MLFKRYHIYPMFLGMKTETRRTWSRRMVKFGRWYPVTHKMFYQPEDVVGEIRIESVRREPLSMITEQDAFHEGGYSRDAFFRVFKEINKYASPKAVIDSDCMVWVIRFKFLLSDIIDPNGGTECMDLYRDEWRTHMKKVMGDTWSDLSITTSSS